MKNIFLIAILITLSFNSETRSKVLKYGIMSDGDRINASGSVTAPNSTDIPFKFIDPAGDNYDTMNSNGKPYRTYTTNFTLTENPISESGNWINGSTEGLDWGYISTTPGQTHTHPGTAQYADATAILTGTWFPDQIAQATVGSTVNACNSTNCYPEVELRLRSTLSAHICNGYEIAFSLRTDGRAYLIIVRWNGPLADFTYLFNQADPKYQVKTGDVIKGIILGNVISAYKNGVLMGQATDDTYTSGNPGMGFNEQSYNGDYGFSSYIASDDPLNLK